MKVAVIIALSLATTAPASAETSYHEFNGTTYGSDGSSSRRYNGDTYIRDRDGHETRCHEFAGNTTCR